MSEFRQDPISGDWVIIAPGRAKRPDELIKKRAPRKRAPKSTCPFEDLKKSGNWPPIIAYPDAKNWEIVVIPNKYPALSHLDGHAKDEYVGVYRMKRGVGEHELVVGYDHDKGLADVSPSVASKIFAIFQERSRAMVGDPCYAYVSVFMNWGPTAGASLWHPHYQILTLPIVPPHVAHSLRGAEAYFKKHKRCVRCDALKEDRKDGTRVIAENADAIAVAPFASRRPFEVSIMPKKHFSYFEKTPTTVVNAVAALTQKVLRSMRKNLQDPDLNFFIHSAPLHGIKIDKARRSGIRKGGPLGDKDYSYHHWHVEIVPVNVVSPPGGFELSTVVNINVIAPEDAARILRK